MQTADSAANEIVERINPLAPVETPISDALGLVIAIDITSPLDMPPWDNSAMDGYAARSADLNIKPPFSLNIVEEIPAGSFPTRGIADGECARVFTGAPVPEGSDCVVRQEDTSRLTDHAVQINDTRDAGRHIRRRAEDFKRGDVVLKHGASIGPGQIGVLASLAMSTVPVHRRPTVAYLASGDEIADLGERDAILGGRKIASSNTYTLRALLQQAGAIPKHLGIAKDDPDDLERRFRLGAEADLIVTTAGISVGEHDLLHQVLEKLQLDRVFWRTKMRPGAPAGFGHIGAFGGKPWIGLPGNPVSTMVTFELFVRPAIRRMQGYTTPFRRTIDVVAGEEITLGPKLKHFLRVTLEPGDEQPMATLTGPQGSGILTSMAHADALMIVPEDVPVVEEGRVLKAIVLDDPRHVAEVPW